MKTIPLAESRKETIEPTRSRVGNITFSRGNYRKRFVSILTVGGIIALLSLAAPSVHAGFNLVQLSNTGGPGPGSAVFTTDEFGGMDECCGVTDPSGTISSGIIFNPNYNSLPAHKIICNQFVEFIDAATGSRAAATDCPLDAQAEAAPMIIMDMNTPPSTRHTTFTLSTLGTFTWLGTVDLVQTASSATQLDQTYTLTNTDTANSHDLIVVFFNDIDVYYRNGADDPNDGWMYNHGRRGPVPASVTIMESGNHTVGHSVRATLTSGPSSVLSGDTFQGWRVAQFDGDNETLDYEGAGVAGFPAAHLNGIFHSVGPAPGDTSFAGEGPGDLNCDGLTDVEAPTVGSTQWKIHFGPGQQTRTFVVTTSLASGPDTAPNPIMLTSTPNGLAGKCFDGTQPIPCPAAGTSVVASVASIDYSAPISVNPPAGSQDYSTALTLSSNLFTLTGIFHPQRPTSFCVGSSVQHALNIGSTTTGVTAPGLDFLVGADTGSGPVTIQNNSTIHSLLVTHAVQQQLTVTNSTIRMLFAGQQFKGITLNHSTVDYIYAGQNIMGGGITLNNASKVISIIVGHQYQTTPVTLNTGSTLACTPPAITGTNNICFPTARFTVCGVPQVTSVLNLDGSASTGFGGAQIQKYVWNVEIAPSGSTAQVVPGAGALATFTPDVSGNYTLELCASNTACSPANCTSITFTVP